MATESAARPSSADKPLTDRPAGFARNRDRRRDDAQKAATATAAERNATLLAQLSSLLSESTALFVLTHSLTREQLTHSLK